MALIFGGWTFLMTLWTINLAATCPDKCNCIDNSTIVCTVSGTVNSTGNDNDFQAFIENRTFENVTLLCNNRDSGIDVYNLSAKVLSFRNCNIRVPSMGLDKVALLKLDLAENNMTEIKDGEFQSLIKLLTLNVSSNKIITISDNSFRGLVYLTTLDLSRNKIAKIGNVFHHLIKLQYLNLSKNNLDYLSENCFHNLSALQHLDISKNRLTRLEPGTLQLLPNLARFILADNNFLGEAHADGQLLIGSGRRLQQIDISRTGLNKIPEAFTHSVRFLSIVGNNITTINCGNMDTYPLLQVLDLSNNSIEYIEEDALGRLELLLFLHLNSNKLTAVPKMLPEELKVLSLTRNVINKITLNDFLNLPNLQILLLQNNVIETLHENVFIQLTNLEVLDLSNNPIKTLTPSTFNGPSTLRDLRLCYLNLSQPAADISFPLQSPEGLQMLHLRESPGLAKQFLADSALLAALSHLQYLDLRMNKITKMRSDLFYYLSQLKVLRLSGNAINCTTMSWLNDWLPLDATNRNKEECYFSTIKENDEKEYNCTFSEMFNFDDSLPSIATYSKAFLTKMIKYYSRFNKTVLTDTKTKQNITDVYEVIQNSLYGYDENNKIFKEKKQNKKKLDFTAKFAQNVRDKKILDIQNLSLLQRSTNYDIAKIDNYLKSKSYDSNNKTGKTINKATNKVPNAKYLQEPIKNTKDKTEMDKSSQGALSLTADTEVLKFYSSKYIGIISITCIVVICCLFWATFRIQIKQRHRESSVAAEDQIEVSNISGAVLW